MTSLFDPYCYMFRADIWCPDCIRLSWVIPEHLSTEQGLNAAAASVGIDRTDEYSFDSDVFPKCVSEAQCHEAEYFNCGTCGEPL